MSDSTEASYAPPSGMSVMDPAVVAAPQSTYREMQEASPVVKADNFVMVFGRSEVEEVLRHPGTFSSDMEATSIGNIRPLIPLQIDPPDHVRYRRILDPLFAPKQMALLTETVETLVHRLIDRFIDRGECDLVSEFTVPLPSEVFLSLLGLPLADLDEFLAMKDGIIRPAGATPEQLAEARSNAASAIYAYFERVLDQRAAEPADDLVTRFLSTEVEGSQLTRHEILDICFLFLIAGLDTVSATLECFFTYLARHDDQRQRLVDDPDLVPRAVEELLRWETPVMGVIRMAVGDCRVGGVQLEAGDQIFAVLGSANVDPNETADAGRVDFGREVNRHLAFGAGVHRCLGSHLARLELRVALREFHARIPHYRLAEGADITFTPGIRSTDHLPLVFGA